MRIETIHCDGCGAIKSELAYWGRLDIDPPLRVGLDDLNFHAGDVCPDCMMRVVDALPVMAAERDRRISKNGAHHD